MSRHWYAYPTPQEAAQACARQIEVILQEALSSRPNASLAVSGGATPRPLFEALARCELAWPKIHLFWVDERCVAPTETTSNYRLADETLIRTGRIPRHNIHRIQGEFNPDRAARRYVEEIREFFELAEGEVPHFDVIQRGMGADGHTASLFAGDALIADRDRVAAATYIEKLNQWRITLLPAVLLAAHHTVMLVTGEEKAEAVRAVFQEPYDPMKWPAQMMSPHGRSAVWYLDKAATRLMD
ncbi:MAG: 6-phosphogluconolactonase [Acidobacteria bacterium]|nr:6-phosphogluconolactonase [Acidobacteriota bacterium]